MEQFNPQGLKSNIEKEIEILKTESYSLSMGGFPTTGNNVRISVMEEFLACCNWYINLGCFQLLHFQSY